MIPDPPPRSPAIDLTRYEGHSEGPWIVATSNSWRRIVTRIMCTPVCEPITQHGDNHPDLHFRNGGEDGPDARLLADAPLLLQDYKRQRNELEALREVYAAAKNLNDVRGRHHSEQAMLRLQAALTKVSGGLK